MQIVEEGKVGIQGALNAKEGKGPAVASVLQSAGVLPDWLSLVTCNHGGPAAWSGYAMVGDSWATVIFGGPARHLAQQMLDSDLCGWYCCHCRRCAR